MHYEWIAQTALSSPRTPRFTASHSNCRARFDFRHSAVVDLERIALRAPTRTSCARIVLYVSLRSGQPKGLAVGALAPSIALRSGRFDMMDNRRRSDVWAPSYSDMVAACCSWRTTIELSHRARQSNAQPAVRAPDSPPALGGAMETWCIVKEAPTGGYHTAHLAGIDVRHTL